MSTAEQIYAEKIRDLPSSERLLLATLILEGLSASAEMLDYSDSWSDEDVADLTRFSLKYAEFSEEEEEDGAEGGVMLSSQTFRERPGLKEGQPWCCPAKPITRSARM